MGNTTSKSAKGTSAKKTAAPKKRPSVKKVTSAAAKKTAVKPASKASLTAVQDEILALNKRLDNFQTTVLERLASLSGEVGQLRDQRVMQLNQLGEKILSKDAFDRLLKEKLKNGVGDQIDSFSVVLRRIEERVGFIGNRLKSSGGNQGRNRPWRREQPPNGRSKGQNAPRQNQNQSQNQNQNQNQNPNWTPPSAASVQGHFAPRPMNRDYLAGQEDDE